MEQDLNALAKKIQEQVGQDGLGNILIYIYAELSLSKEKFPLKKIKHCFRALTISKLVWDEGD